MLCVIPPRRGRAPPGCRPRPRRTSPTPSPASTLATKGVREEGGEHSWRNQTSRCRSYKPPRAFFDGIGTVAVLQCCCSVAVLRRVWNQALSARRNPFHLGSFRRGTAGCPLTRRPRTPINAGSGAAETCVRKTVFPPIRGGFAFATNALPRPGAWEWLAAFQASARFRLGAVLGSRFLLIAGLRHVDQVSLSLLPATKRWPARVQRRVRSVTARNGPAPVPASPTAGTPVQGIRTPSPPTEVAEPILAAGLARLGERSR